MGILETEQETIIATRNAVVVQTKVSQTTSRDRTSTTTSTKSHWKTTVRQMEDDGEENRDNMDDGTDPLHKHFLLRKRMDVS